MLNHGDNAETQLPTAAQVRVTPRELTEALASLDARKARQDYEQAGTITLTEAIQDCRVEATPEELQAEIATLRDADTQQEKIQTRQQRLKIILASEIISAALCLLTLFGLQHTLFDKKWQQARQAEEFQQKLHQSSGPNPKYDIVVVPESLRWPGNSGLTIMALGGWADEPAYPLYSLPDGYNIHHTDGLTDEGFSSSIPPYMFSRTAYVEFCQPQVSFFRDNVSVFYNGLQYWRARIRKEDIPLLLGGHPFTLYPALVAGTQYHMADSIPLTVSTQSIRTAGGQWGQAYPECYTVVRFAEGKRVSLDEHAWEHYNGSFSK